MYERFISASDKVLVPVVSHQECQNKLQKSRKNPRRPWKLHPSFMCAGGNHNVQFSKGDEGFPLICPKQNPEVRHMLYGMTSRDLFCGKHSDPTVYVDVAKFRDWIDAKIMAIRLTTKTYTIRDKIIIEYY
ncbi:jg5779 [Pararge aegeria aegeria]|uniref:Jg5779 protein n=1 Tax=Pararge aegeria aegeria TaxID=348720 RepID=A0A8S4QP54_9NEOP|nr:jg5779 [Pararge aegeria aegeria]